MPLHISIDVDGTLINHNGDLAPQAKHALETLQAADARLQLWSAGGADYAKATAEKYDLSDMFNSFATKSDLAVDDEPESAHPLATIAVTEDYPLSEAARDIQESLAKCADIALSPPSQQIVAMVQQLQAHTPFGNPAYAGLFPPNCQYHPIPFFGPLEAARVITIGLNPSSGEFASWRLWNSQLSAHDLASRLHNYFRLVRPRPHRGPRSMTARSFVIRT